MSENTAITAKDNLRKAIKAGKTECHTIAANIEKIVSEALWEYLTLPGDTAADKLHALITLPDSQGGLNCKIDDFYALISIRRDVERKVREIVNKANQGARNDLKLEKKVNAVTSKPKRPKGTSNSNKASDRAAERAAKAVPKIDELLNEGLVSKRNAAKIGQVVKNPDRPTEKEREIIEQRKKLNSKLDKIVPNPLPEEPDKRKEIQKTVQQAIEETTGKVTPPKINLGSDPKKVAEAIAKAKNDFDYLLDLAMELELITQQMQPSLAA